VWVICIIELLSAGIAPGDLWPAGGVHRRGSTVDDPGDFAGWNASGLEGRNVAHLEYTGSVAGTLLSGFVLMPAVGLRNAFGVLAMTLALAAIVLAWRCRWHIGTGAATV